jgi:phospholipid transport system substrate-binding protein
MTAPLNAAWTLRTTLRQIILAFALAMSGFAMAGTAPAAAATAEEAYVKHVTDQAIKILTDKSLDQNGRYDAFHTLILDNIALDRIAAFVLGRYAGAMRASGRYDEYQSLFGDYIARVYAARLSGYSGERVEIQRTVPQRPNDILVFSVIQPGKEGGDPVPVNWRITNEGEQYRILDVQVVGAWMSIEQQSQFSSIIANNHRDVTKLIDYLREQAGTSLPNRS